MKRYEMKKSKGNIKKLNPQEQSADEKARVKQLKDALKERSAIQKFLGL